MIALLVMTDGRRDCIERTIVSAKANLLGPITTRLIWDDSGDDDYCRWLARFHKDGFTVARGAGRSGFGGAIQGAWRYLSTRSTERYVFHLEDDFTFNRPVDLVGMAQTLSQRPHLAQLALRRQPWNDAERAAGGIVECWPQEYSDHIDDDGHGWLEHCLFFTTNPCLYRREVMADGWPRTDASERRFTYRLLQDGFGDTSGDEVRFGFWGTRSSGEAVTHIGAERVGCGY